MLFIRTRNDVYLQAGKRSGAAAVELALVSPVLVMLFLGMTEMSRMMMVKVTLNDAARTGCQTGTLPGKSNQNVTDDVIRVMRNGGFDSTRFNPPSLGSIAITVTDPGGRSVADTVTALSDSIVSVQVTIPVSSTAWITSTFTSGSTSQVETVVMKKQ